MTNERYIALQLGLEPTTEDDLDALEAQYCGLDTVEAFLLERSFRKVYPTIVAHARMAVAQALNDEIPF